MSITRSQQAKQTQLVKPKKDGTRPGYYGADAGFGDDDYKDASASFDAGDGRGGSDRDFSNARKAIQEREKIKEEIAKGPTLMKRFRRNPFVQAGRFFSNPVGFGIDKILDARRAKRVNELFGVDDDLGYTGADAGFVVSQPEKPEIPQGGGDGQDNTGIMQYVFTPFQQDVIEDSMDTGPVAEAIRLRDQMGGARLFAADGGRMGLQEGGGIEQRLEQLGGDVTSAEQMLQGINKRLETAESSLGSSSMEGLGSLQQPAGLGIFAGRPIQLPGIRPDFSATIDPNFKPVEELKAVQPGDPGYRAPGPTTLNGVVIDNPNTNNAFPSVEEAYANAQKEAAESRRKGFLGQVVLPGEMSFEDFSNTFNRFNPSGQLGIPAAGYADGGNVKGGIIDLEQAREGYKLGKLVGKIGRAIKKIGKSKVGKAALAASAFVPFGEKGSLFRRFMGTPVGEGVGDFFSNMDTGDKLALAASGALVAAPFVFGEDDTEDEYQKFLAQRGGQGIDIPGIRAKPYDTLARAFVAEGGKPEPVAKKTMPLLDMGGKEMDLREEGGFVPIGRMEKADDVPARLSKNEFVFTADAVRNAGDGNVDKGAEVMYNMMKNLEAGGEVSEESQGLDGARKMFQTSQRLEEVL